MVVSTFFVLNKDNRKRFFEKTLLTDIKLNIVLGISFLTMSNADIDFHAQDLKWRFYITRYVLPTTKHVELIEKKEFTTAALDLKHNVFIVHIATLIIDLDDEVHPLKKAKIAHLKINKALTEIFSEYANFAHIFSLKLSA